VVAAIDDAGRDNPFFGIDIRQDQGSAEAGPGDQARAAATGQPTPPSPRAASELVDAVGEWLGVGERRVAASLVVLGYSARLVGPATAVLLREGILLDLRPSNLELSYQPARGFSLTLLDPAGWAGTPAALLQGWRQLVIDEQLGPLVSAVQAATPVATGLLWGNVASGLAGALRALAATGRPSPARCYDTGVTLLRQGPLRNSGQLTLDDVQLQFTRRSCCLYYRIPGGGTCGDCPLPPAYAHLPR
jgi:siderophore-iron reductase FhuF